MSCPVNSFVRYKYASDNPSVHGINDLSDSEPSSGQEHYRHLLSDKVKITPELFPELASSLKGVGQAIGLADDIQSFVYADPVIQACCVSHHDAGRRYFIVLLSSGIVEKLNFHELRFVIGHEVGHFLCEHWRYPRASSMESPSEKLAAMQLSQCAEISADRLGFLASGSLQAACSALLKTAAGLGEPYLKPNITSFLNQFRDLVEKEGNASSAWATHPIIPLRIRSLLRFDTVARQIMSGQDVSNNEIEKVDHAINEDFRKSHGNVLERMEEELIGKVKTWALIWIIISDGILTKEEQSLLHKIHGAERAEQLIVYLKGDTADLKSDLLKKMEKSCADIKSFPSRKRLSVFEDLKALTNDLIKSEDEYEKAIMDVKKALGL